MIWLLKIPVKNPQAVLKAFLHAFPYEKNTGLVIKVIRNKTRVSHLEEPSEPSVHYTK